MILYFDIFETLRIYHPAIYTSNVSAPATTAEDSAHGGGADVGGGTSMHESTLSLRLEKPPKIR